MKEVASDAKSIELEHENQWLGNKIFLHAVEEEMVKKCTDASINNKKLITILRNIYEKEARLYPLSMQSLSLTGSFVLPKAIFIPPSQVVTLVAEYDADMTIEELSRKLIKSEKINEPKRRIRYADNLLLRAAIQRRAMHMTNVLFELGRNIVTRNLSTLEGDTKKILCSHTLLPVLECHLCHFKTESRIVLEVHKEIPHYIRHRYRCSFCTQSFINFREIKTHFSKKHGILARKDYWNTRLECSSCAIMCGSEFSLKKHRKFCCFVKTGFTMFATRKQASCAINEDVWNATTNNDLLRQKFEYSISWKRVNQKETNLFRKQDAQHWLQEDFSTDDFCNSSYIKRNISMEKGMYNSPENNSISNCICNRSEKTVVCLTCGTTFRGHAARVCDEHPRRINLMDIRFCPNTSCRSKHLMEFENIDASDQSPIQPSENFKR